MTALYTMLIGDVTEITDEAGHVTFDSDSKVILEIYHGDDPEREHEVIRLHEVIGDVSDDEIQEAITEYKAMYGV